jgi:hypothetical protein
MMRDGRILKIFQNALKAEITGWEDEWCYYDSTVDFGEPVPDPPREYGRPLQA